MIITANGTEFEPFEIVEAVDINQAALDRDRDELSGECFRWMAVQFLNTYGGIPMRILAINPPYMILKSIPKGQRVLVDTRLISFRPAPVNWVKHFVS